MGFTFQPAGERPEWMPPVGHYLLGVFRLGEAMVDYKQGNGPERQAEWGFVVLTGPELGKRIIENTSFSFFAGGNGLDPAKAYKWIKVLRFKGQMPPPDYVANSDDIEGRIAWGTCSENAKGRIRVSSDLLPVTALPDGVTLDGVKATMEQARIDHAAYEAERAARNGAPGYTNGNGHSEQAFGDPNAALAAAAAVDMAASDIPW